MVKSKVIFIDKYNGEIKIKTWFFKYDIFLNVISKEPDKISFIV